jgi:hypothetical protein
MANNSVEYILSLKDKFSYGISKATSKTEQLNKAVNATQGAFGSLAGAMGIGLGIAGLVSFGSAVKDSLVRYEYFSASLRTLMMGDAQAAKALENQLVETAKTTPFSLVEVQDATKQLLAYGFSAGKVVENIRMLGDVASALKIPFSDIAYLYGTLKTQGRAFSKDIYQFTGRGIPIVKELAKQFKVANGEVMKLVESGKVGFKEVEKAFQSMTAEGGMFFDMMQQQAKTTGGQISALGDSWEQLKVNIGRNEQSILNNTVSFLNKMVDHFSRRFGEIADQQEHFAKFGAKAFRGFWNPARVFELGAYEEQTQFERALRAMYVDAPAKTAKDAAEQMQQLTNLLQNNRKALRLGEIDQTEFFRKRAAILGTYEKVKGQFGLLTTPVSATQAAAQGMGEAKTKAEAKGGTGLNILESRGVQNFNISIDKLVEMIKVETTQIKEGAGEIKEIVAQALIEAVNDFQLMATK